VSGFVSFSLRFAWGFTKIVFVIASLAVLGWALMGCGGQPIPDNKQDAKTEEVAPELYEDDPDDIRAQGSLPPGYNQRQCQWDACGPMPITTNVAVNPVPGETTR